jgi:hypothetical protein
MNKNLCTNGFLLIFKIYFHNIRGTPSHLLRLTVWESLLYLSNKKKVNWNYVQYSRRQKLLQEYMKGDGHNISNWRPKKYK